jgi:L-lactate dehydrogenase complex protein LldG
MSGAGASAGVPDGMLDLVVDRLEDYRASVHRVGPNAVPRAIGSWAESSQPVVVPAGFPEDWLPEGVRLTYDQPPLTASELDSTGGVVSTCMVALAETGTLVLDGYAGQGRRALTLVPDRLLVVVAAAQVVRGVPDAIARLDPRRPMTWISGPSATSDIEVVRVERVHGPRHLDVVLVNPSA